MNTIMFYYWIFSYWLIFLLILGHVFPLPHMPGDFLFDATHCEFYFNEYAQIKEKGHSPVPSIIYTLTLKNCC